MGLKSLFSFFSLSLLLMLFFVPSLLAERTDNTGTKTASGTNPALSETVRYIPYQDLKP